MNRAIKWKSFTLIKPTANLLMHQTSFLQVVCWRLRSGEHIHIDSVALCNRFQRRPIHWFIICVYWWMILWVRNDSSSLLYGSKHSNFHSNCDKQKAKQKLFVSFSFLSPFIFLVLRLRFSILLIRELKDLCSMR